MQQPFRMSRHSPIEQDLGSGRSAVLDESRVYRYSLTRSWSTAPAVNFIGLNPSTADEEADDPTIRRCVAYAKTWGRGELVMTNLFAFRATEPGDMRKAMDPIGPDNDDVLLYVARSTDLVIAAWGVHGDYMGRGERVRLLLRKWGIRLRCLGQTVKGHPRHPLYLRADLEPDWWRP